jgi:hypothetical protein
MEVRNAARFSRTVQPAVDLVLFGTRIGMPVRLPSVRQLLLRFVTQAL